MNRKKVFILLPDGVGLRNFAYSNFNKIGVELGFEVIYWNNTPFKLNDLGFHEIKIQYAKPHLLTDILKNAQKQIELRLNTKKTKDAAYENYNFPLPCQNLKDVSRIIGITALKVSCSSEKGLQKLKALINKNERKTPYYLHSLETLKKEKPSLVFCTNQRPVLAIAPLLAAQDLGIPTATFIFSWDNLPKATMVVDTDYYFVWSQHMKNELLFYYPDIEESKVFVTGTPQFESHFDKSKIVSREVFFKQHNLDLQKKYLCYSGDDITTSPDDHQYLEDVAKAVVELNAAGNQLGIIFRRCPVDFSDRYDSVLESYKDVIIPIEPKWEQFGNYWNAILPTIADIDLQINTIKHTDLVINLGSSMVFDYVTQKKPCLYINYDVPNRALDYWSVRKIYDYIHFRSMPSKEAVIWLNSPDEIQQKILGALDDSKNTVSQAQKWFEMIVHHPPESASERIWDQIKTISK
jgi:hypothetical protein